MAWVSAAFLHFTVQQQADPEEKGEVLRRLGPKTDQVSSFSFHFQEESLFTGEFRPNAEVAKMLPGEGGSLVEGLGARASSR